MKYQFLLTILISGTTLFAQQSIPVFSTKPDSIEFAKIQTAIQELFKRAHTKETASQVDSLFKLQLQFREKIIGYRTIYTSANTFTSYDELIQGKVIPTSITKLSIAGNHTNIPKTIRACTNLEALELVNTTIRKLPARLAKFSKLKSISIYNNQSRTKLRLGKNKVITHLLFRGFDAKVLPKSFKKFSSLEDLNLSRNIGLSAFPDINKNKKLKKLNLSENNITLDDLKSTSLSSLENLNLQKNKIKKVPDAIGCFSTLKKITFSYNYITDVDQAINKLKELKELSFYQNKLKAIPSGIYEMPWLKVIDLYYNEIEKIEPRISNLKNLEVLYLSNNKITSLPDNLGELTNLRELYLSNNRLFALPGSLKDLQNLSIFRINNNKLTDFPEFIFELPGIENLDISSNNIQLIPEKVTAIPKLSLFVLADNPINNDEVEIAKIVETLTARGIIVHQNSINLIVDEKP